MTKSRKPVLNIRMNNGMDIRIPTGKINRLETRMKIDDVFHRLVFDGGNFRDPFLKFKKIKKLK